MTRHLLRASAPGLLVWMASLALTPVHAQGTWTEIADEVVDSRVNQTAIDSAGTLYALIVKSDKSKTVKKYRDYAWHSCNEGLTEPASILYADRSGKIYARAGEGIYLLGPEGWKEVFRRNNNNYPKPYDDGHLYTKSTTYNEKSKLAEESRVERWENGAYQPVGKDGRPLLLPNPDCRFNVSRQGVILAYDDHPYGTPQTEISVHQWTGEKWQTIGTLPCDISYEGFDANDHWIVSGRENHIMYFKRWDGRAWSDMPVPPGVSTEGSFGHFTPLFDEARNVYTYGYEESTHRYILFRLDKAQWTPVAKGAGDVDVSFFIPARDGVFAVDDYRKKFYRYDRPVATEPGEVIDFNVVYTPKPDTDIIPFRDKFDKWGARNAKGEILFAPKFNAVYPFYDGVAFVYDGLAALVDRTGKELTPYIFYSTEPFSEGLAVVSVCDENGENCKWSYIDRTGKTVLALPEKYKGAGSFYDGLAWVSTGNEEEGYLFGYIDKTGREVIPPIFSEAGDFANHRAAVVVQYDIGFINRKGEFVVPPKYYRIYELSDYRFSEGLAMVRLDEAGYPAEHKFRYWFIDVNGKEAISMGYGSPGPFENGVSVVFGDDKHWLVDRTGKMITPRKYDQIYPFSDGLARVQINDQYGFPNAFGFVDYTGKEVVPPMYRAAGDFSEGLACVMTCTGSYLDESCTWSVIDGTGKTVFTLPYGADEASRFSEGLLMVFQCQEVEENTVCKYGFVDRTGKLVIPLKYDFADAMYGGFSDVELNGEYLKVDTKGVEHRGGKSWGDED